MSAEVFKPSLIFGKGHTKIWSTDNIYSKENQISGMTAFMSASRFGAEYIVSNATLKNHGQGAITIAIREAVDDVDSVIVREPGRVDEINKTGSSESLASVQSRINRLLDGTANDLPSSDYRKNSHV